MTKIIAMKGRAKASQFKKGGKIGFLLSISEVEIE